MSTFLFDEFNPVSAAAWKQKIQVDLKGADYNETLLTKTDEDIVIKPFYTKEDATNTKINLPKSGFTTCQSLFVGDEKIANKLAINALKRGAKAVQFIAEKPFDFSVLLKDIETSTTTIYFKLNFLSDSFVQKLQQFTNSKNTFFQIDIIGNLAQNGNWFFNLTEDQQQLHNIVNKTDNSIHVNASLYQNAGANITQQLAYTLAHANEYLNYFGNAIASKIHFSFSVGSNYFFEIAKLRAFRILWQALLQEYKISQSTAHIFVQPTLRNKTLYDYNVNMLRTTTECMSAILGGANTISNVAYDKIYHKSNEFGERIARNQLLILQQESYLQEAQNFADGTYYIESITNQLAEKALQIFKQIEKGGGFLKQLKEGVIQRKINESAQKEEEKFLSGVITLLGTNKLENKEDKMQGELELYPFLKIRNQKTLITPILPKRLAESVEQKRLKDE